MRTYHWVDFQKVPSALACALIYILVLRSMARERRTTHSLEWEGTQTLRRERHAHIWPSMVRGAMLARPTMRANYHRTLESGKTQTLRKERHAHRWPSRWGEQMLALPIASSGEKRTHSSEWEGTQTLRSGAQGTNPGLTSSNKGTKLRA